MVPLTYIWCMCSVLYLDILTALYSEPWKVRYRALETYQEAFDSSSNDKVP